MVYGSKDYFKVQKKKEKNKDAVMKSLNVL